MTEEELSGIAQKAVELTKDLEPSEMLYVVEKLINIKPGFTLVPIWFFGRVCRSANAEKVIITKDFHLELKASKNGSLKIGK